MCVCVKVVFHMLLLTKKILAGRKGRIKHNVEIIFYIITVRTERESDGEEKRDRQGEKEVGRRKERNRELYLNVNTWCIM